MLFVVLFMLDIVLYRHGKYSGNIGDDGCTVFGLFVLCTGQKEWDCIDSDGWIYGMPYDIRSRELCNLVGSKEVRTEC